MRTIKFRAWDEKLKRWEVWGLPEDAGYIAGRFNKTNATKSGRRFSSSTLTQFTGLLDKNGNEIYEGDVVKYTRANNLPDDKWPHAQITWLNKHGVADTARFVLQDENAYQDLPSFTAWIEVIGNIYENPEMLKDHD